MEGEPPDKKARTFDKNKCIICFNSLAKLKGNDKVVRNPTIQGLTTILDIARVKNDAVYDALFPLEDQIKLGEVKVSFHKLCRASYTSTSNTYMYTQDQSDVSLGCSAAPSTCGAQPPRRSSRSDECEFSIRRDCFICGSNDERKEKLTLI